MQNRPEHDQNTNSFQQLQRTDRILNSIDVGCYELDSKFNFTYINAKAEKVFSRQREHILGSNIWDVFPEFLNTGYHTIINLAILDKQASTHEFISGFIHQWVSLSAIPSNDGAIVLFKEINEVKETKAQLQKQQQQLDMAKETVQLGYFKFNLDTEKLRWSDEMYHLFGLEPQSEQMTLEKILSYIHPQEKDRFCRYLKKVFDEQRPFELIYRIITPTNQVKVLIEHGAFLKDEQGKFNCIHGLVQDITEQEKAKQELKESKDLLQSVFDTSLIGMSVLQAVYNESGGIADFRIQMVNKELERETQRTDLVGKLCSKEYPGIKKTGLYDMMLRVMETGQPEQTEYYYGHDGFDKWFSCTFVKKDKGLVASNLDITARKLAEQEKLKSLAILQQSEELAKIGSWEYELQSGKFICSDGMYQLFGLEKDTKVKPEIYLEYATEQSRPVAARIVNFLKEGTTDFKEELEIIVLGEVKIIKVKAIAVYDEAGRPVRFIGVDKDITAPIKLEQEKRQLEMQQIKLKNSQNQRIFLATLNAQEEERKRISESLHNGLGQLLYGVKLSLDRLNFYADDLDIEELKEVKQNTSVLLTEAIKESRRISHELTPTILEDFGLKEALKDICNQFKSGVTIICKFIGLSKRLSKHIEIAIYRTIQELVMNVIKHAEATEAFVTIEINSKAVNLTVKDNGIGFNSKQQSTGIGLKTIQNKVKLLNGTYQLTSGKGEDTVVSISIPYL